MIQDNTTAFQSEICAYKLATEALYHQSIPSHATLPGEALYEVTQIFLDRVQKFATASSFDQINKSEHTKKFFNINLPKSSNERKHYPVEILFSAYAIQDVGKRSPISLFYSCASNIPQHIIKQAKKVTESLKDFEKVVNDHTSASLCFKTFDRSWMSYLASINQIQMGELEKIHFLFQNAPEFFRKYYQKENFGAYSSDPTYRSNSEKYRECCDELCKHFEKREARENLSEFLSEWNSMPEGTKDNASNNDLFVKAFQSTMEKIRNLTFYSHTV